MTDHNAIRDALADSGDTFTTFTGKCVSSITADDLRKLLDDYDRLRDEVRRLREELAAKSVQKYGCHCDLDPGMKPDACVFDTGAIADCVYAKRLKRKEDCEYWRVIATDSHSGISEFVRGIGEYTPERKQEIMLEVAKAASDKQNEVGK